MVNDPILSLARKMVFLSIYPLQNHNPGPLCIVPSSASQSTPYFQTNNNSVRVGKDSLPPEETCTGDTTTGPTSPVVATATQGEIERSRDPSLPIAP